MEKTGGRLFREEGKRGVGDRRERKREEKEAAQ